MFKYFKISKIAVVSIFVLLLAIFLLPNFCLAQDLDTGLEYGEKTGLGDTDPRIIIARIIRYGLGFLGILAVGLIMYAGWLWMTSEGNEEKVEQAKKVLKNALIGLIIIMSAFAIVSFILNKLAGGSGVSSPGGGGGISDAGGIGVIGACSVESVYPEPNQTEVPRNTSIIVTFKEEVNPSTICEDSSGDGIYCNCSNGICDSIVKENVRIFKTNQGDSCQYENEEWINCESFNVTDVHALSNNNKIFVFVPKNYLGSPSEYIWYSVYMSNDVRKKSDNEGIFNNCRMDYLEWKFQVSNKIDLTPPQVEAGGVFPPPDNERDIINMVEGAISATGIILVDSQPEIHIASAVGSPSPQGNSGEATTNSIYNCQEDGNIILTIGPNLTAEVSGVVGAVSGDDVNDGVASLGCGLTLSPASGSFAAGNQWIIAVTAAKQADTLTVGGVVYTFVADAPSANQIQRGGNISGTAGNIGVSLSVHSDVDSSVVNNIVNVIAKVAGQAGNNIVLTTSNPTALQITPMSGGKDRETSTTVKGRVDKPRNAIIQINFNEAVNPLTISGEASEVADYIRVVNASPAAAATGGVCNADADCVSFNCDNGVCAGNNSYLEGKFMISNQYRTVEFISNNNCGVNSCGEEIYCLPENSHLRVEIMAANLADCGFDNCVSRSPFNNCVDNICQDSAGKKYPMADILTLDGIVDVAMNSLDGNRDEAVQGPVTFYNENFPLATEGDNYQWSFFISDKIDLSPPKIKAINPSHNTTGINLADAIKVGFDKLMMSSSFKTGSKNIFNGQDYIEHKLINLWSFTNQSVGYWITKNNFDEEPLDGEPDWTQAEIRHSMFSDTTSYRAQVGSGIKDIYQNCFKPSASATCAGSPSCCGEVPTADDSCP